MNPGPDRSILISGARWEKSTALYVRNINREERSGKDISQDVRECGRLGEVRFMQVDVVKNRYCEDVVGCRIRVPTSQVERVTSIEFWPDDIVCRGWKSRRANPSQDTTGQY